jgi:hypothetical protein
MVGMEKLRFEQDGETPANAGELSVEHEFKSIGKAPDAAISQSVFPAELLGLRARVLGLGAS